MKKLFSILTRLVVCNICHGNGYIETPGGDTKECPSCKGKGYK